MAEALTRFKEDLYPRRKKLLAAGTIFTAYLVASYKIGSLNPGFPLDGLTETVPFHTPDLQANEPTFHSPRPAIIFLSGLLSYILPSMIIEEVKRW